MSGLSQTEYKFKEAFDIIQQRIHDSVVEKGFWEDAETALDVDSPDSTVDHSKEYQAIQKFIVGQKIALIHSEVSEALEGSRKDLMDDHLPSRSMLEVELADTVIRIMDLAQWLGLDLSGAILEKFSYNQSRPYKHGKQF